MAAGFMGALETASVSVPEDVSVIGFDDAEIAQWLRPELTTIRQPLQEIGAAAARMLISSINSGVAEKIDRLFPAKLIERKSVRSLINHTYPTAA